VIVGKTAADIKPGSTAAHRQAAGVAARTMGMFGAILNYAVEQGYRATTRAGVVSPAGNGGRSISTLIGTLPWGAP
jgi:hypothetical protein